MASAGSRIIREKNTTQLNTNNWLLDFSEPSYVDDFPQDKRYDPDQDHLDYALLILEKPVGSEEVKEHPDLKQRGWIELPNKHYSFGIGDPIIMPQHPKGKHLHLVISTNGYRSKADNDTRLYYSIKTDYGSSGSPCFNKNWELIGIHQGINENTNYLDQKTIIPITAITNRIRERDIDLIEATKKNEMNSVNVGALAIPNVSSEVTLDTGKASPQPDLSIDELNQKLIEQVDEIERMFGYNSRVYLDVLQQEVSKVNNKTISNSLVTWLEGIVHSSIPPNLPKHVWFFVCLEKHIQLIGVKRMFQNLPDDVLVEIYSAEEGYTLFRSIAKLFQDRKEKIAEQYKQQADAISIDRHIEFGQKLLTYLQELKTVSDQTFALLEQYQYEEPYPAHEIHRFITGFEQAIFRSSRLSATGRESTKVVSLEIAAHYKGLDFQLQECINWFNDLATASKHTISTFSFN